MVDSAWRIKNDHTTSAVSGSILGTAAVYCVFYMIPAEELEAAHVEVGGCDETWEGLQTATETKSEEIGWGRQWGYSL